MGNSDSFDASDTRLDSLESFDDLRLAEIIHPELTSPCRDCDACIRRPALLLSGVVALFVLGLHAFFLFNHMDYDVPEVAWALILSPWLGAGVSKAIKIFKKQK